MPKVDHETTDGLLCTDIIDFPICSSLQHELHAGGTGDTDASKRFNVFLHLRTQVTAEFEAK